MTTNLYLVLLMSRDVKDKEIHRFGHATPVLINLTKCQLSMNKDFTGTEVAGLVCLTHGVPVSLFLRWA